TLDSERHLNLLRRKSPAFDYEIFHSSHAGAHERPIPWNKLPGFSIDRKRIRPKLSLPGSLPVIVGVLDPKLPARYDHCLPAVDHLRREIEVVRLTHYNRNDLWHGLHPFARKSDRGVQLEVRQIPERMQRRVSVKLLRLILNLRLRQPAKGEENRQIPHGLIVECRTPCDFSCSWVLRQPPPPRH